MKLTLWTAALVFSMAKADETCPWLNAATAGGILGGDVAVRMEHLNQEDENCEFTRRAGSAASTLRIEVATTKAPAREFAARTAQCVSKQVPLRAIGNEAVACSASGETAEQVVGRVRDRVFVVRIGTTDAAASRDSLREKARMVAEQVAGFLF